MCDRNIKTAVGRCGFDQRGCWIFHPRGDRPRRQEQEAAIFGARNEQNALVQPAPAIGDEIGRRPEVIAEQDRVDAGLLGVSQHFGPRPAGVGGVFGVGVQDRPIVVKAGAERSERAVIAEAARRRREPP